MKANPADKVQHWEIEKLIPYARNSRTHSDEQVSQIAASMREWGVTSAVLVDEEGGIIAGHGRVMAAKKLGMTTLPVMVASGWTDSQKRAFVIADNKLALNAGWDAELLSLEYDALKEDGFEMDLLGFSSEDLDALLDETSMSEEKASDSDKYTTKIKIPVYEPKGERPKVSELYDNSRTLELIKEIEETKLPAELKQFLKLAAERHTKFHFRNIAEFYAHADDEVKELFEQSALVIIDWDKAIENGFIKMTDRLGQIADEEGFNEL